MFRKKTKCIEKLTKELNTIKAKFVGLKIKKDYLQLKLRAYESADGKYDNSEIIMYNGEPYTMVSRTLYDESFNQGEPTTSVLVCSFMKINNISIDLDEED